MIVVTDKQNTTTIAFITPMQYKIDKYTVLLQNTVTKEVNTIDVIDNGGGIYIKFDVNLSKFDDGEYTIMVFENTDRKPFEVYSNDLEQTYRNVVYYLSINNTLLTENDFFVVEEHRKQITPLKTDLLRIGDYKRNTTTYKSEQTYIQYKK